MEKILFFEKFVTSNEQERNKKKERIIKLKRVYTIAMPHRYVGNIHTLVSISHAANETTVRLYFKTP